MGKPKFPQRIYVVEEDTGDDSWYRTETNIRDCATVNQDTTVAMYELIQTGTAKAQIVVDFTTK